METLGKWLKKMRIDKDLTLKTFAEIMGYNSSAYVSGIENGRIKPSDDFVEKFLNKFPQYQTEKKILNKLMKEQCDRLKVRDRLNSRIIKLIHEFQDDLETNSPAFEKDFEKFLQTYKNKREKQMESAV